MRKGFMVTMVLAVLAALGLAACAGGTTTAAELKPVTVSLADVYTVFGGKESITLQADFKVKNPNTTEVKLDSFEFTLAANDKNFGYLQTANDYYIPADTEIVVSGVVSVPFSNVVSEMVMGKGLSAADATKEVLPYWKKMGGVNPSDPMKPVWDAADTKVTYKATGTAYAASGDQRKDTRFTLTLDR